MQYIPGTTLREPPRDQEEKRRILASVIRVDWELLRAGVRQGDDAGRNYILRDDGAVAMVDFGVAYLLHQDRRLRTKDDMVKRWSYNYDFQSAGWLGFQEDGGEGNVAGRNEAHSCAGRAKLIVPDSLVVSV